MLNTYLKIHIDMHWLEDWLKKKKKRACAEWGLSNYFLLTNKRSFEKPTEQLVWVLNG